MLLQQITTSWRECVNQPGLRRLVEMLSPECKDLLDHMFVTDARERYTIEQASVHTWRIACHCPVAAMTAVAPPASKPRAGVDHAPDNRCMDQHIGVLLALAQVKTHPWMTKPLPEHFQQALDRIDEEQHILEEELERRRSQAFLNAMKHRNVKIKQILEESKASDAVLV